MNDLELAREGQIERIAGALERIATAMERVPVDTTAKCYLCGHTEESQLRATSSEEELICNSVTDCGARLDTQSTGRRPR